MVVRGNGRNNVDWQRRLNVSEAVLKLVNNDEAAGEVERREGDRRQQRAIADPRFWVSICAVLLTFSIFAFTFMYSRFAEMLAAQQAMVLSITKQDEKREALTDRVTKIETQQGQAASQQQSFNLDITARLAAVEATNGAKSKKGSSE